MEKYSKKNTIQAQGRAVMTAMLRCIDELEQPPLGEERSTQVVCGTRQLTPMDD
jgi:hypothetical protein